MQRNNQSLSLHKSYGVSLTEVVVASIVVLLLVALLMPSLQQSRNEGRRSACKNNLKQFGLALHNYYDVHNSLPPGWIGVTDNAPAADGNNGKTLFYFLLPYMEASPVYDDLETNISGNGHASMIAQPQRYDWSMFHCHKSTDPRMINIKRENGSTFTAIKTNYAGVFGAYLDPSSTGDSLLKFYTSTLPAPDQLQGNGCFSLNSSVDFREITDGTSNTLFLGEITKQDLIKPGQTTSSEVFSGAWLTYIPQSTFPAARFLRSTDVAINSKNNLSFSSPHQGGAQFCLGDGAVRFIAEDIDPKLFKAQAVINDYKPTGTNPPSY